MPRQRRKISSPVVAVSPPAPARALRLAERDAVLARLHEERFQDRSPAAVYATLLDEGEYHCSIRTMYRLLKQSGESRERRDQLTHPPYQKPELLATAPNQLWSWDITKLLEPAKWSYFYLYVLLDVFSRYVTGWMVAMRESAELAKRLIEESCKKQCMQPGRLTLHADSRGLRGCLDQPGGSGFFQREACQVLRFTRLGKGAQAPDVPVDKFRDWQENTNSIFCPRPLALGNSKWKSGSTLE